MGDVKFIDLFDPNKPRSPEELAKDRMDVCRNCPDLGPLFQCKHCKCFMKLKTKLADAQCPLGKW